jgi:hypothetical protein
MATPERPTVPTKTPTTIASGLKPLTVLTSGGGVVDTSGASVDRMIFDVVVCTDVTAGITSDVVRKDSTVVRASGSAVDTVDDSMGVGELVDTFSGSVVNASGGEVGITVVVKSKGSAVVIVEDTAFDTVYDPVDVDELVDMLPASIQGVSDVFGVSMGI